MAITAGDSLNSVPAAQQQTLSSNYIDFNQDMGWAQQYLPELMEKEAEVFGPRTISGFLSKVGAEEAMQSDQVIWSEQGRLHLSYKVKSLQAILTRVLTLAQVLQLELQLSKILTVTQLQLLTVFVLTTLLL